MYAVAKKLKKKHNIEGDEREALYKAINDWLDAIGDRKYLGGTEPCNADLVVFGVLRSITSLP